MKRRIKDQGTISGQIIFTKERENYDELFFFSSEMTH